MTTGKGIPQKSQNNSAVGLIVIWPGIYYLYTPRSFNQSDPFFVDPLVIGGHLYNITVFELTSRVQRF